MPRRRLQALKLSSVQFVCADQRVARRQCLPVRIGELVDDDAGADVASPGLRDKRLRGERLAGGLKPIVDERDGVAGPACRALQTQDVLLAAIVDPAFAVT